jgi:AcrR family transcriptional regulator
MPQPLLDLLWRDHPQAPRGGSRGPKARVSTGTVVEAALRIADEGGIAEVRVRELAAALGVSTMAVYTHVNSRDELLVLMVDAAHARMDRLAFGRAGWRTRVRRLAADNLALYGAHPWLLDVTDDRSAFGPGTISKYDYELHAFDGLDIDDVTRDAALTFLLDFVRASARAMRPRRPAADTASLWAQWSDRLATYLGEGYPLAVRVGAAAGQVMNAPHSPPHAYEFGLDRVIDALAGLVRSETQRTPAARGPAIRATGTLDT